MIFTQEMLQSMKKVEAAREANIALEPRRMTAEEKDALLAEYCFARGTAAELDAIDRGSMIGRRDGRYGSEAIIRRAAAPAGLSLSPVSIEDLFIFMVKEGGRQ